jgi:hypothetical protein
MPIRLQIVTERWNPISAAIRFQTRSWASHAEFIDLEARTTLGARCRGGVQVRPCAKDHYSRVEQFVLNSPDSPHLLRLAWDWLYARRGTPYNYKGIVGIATDLTIVNPKALDCSHGMFSSLWLGADFPLLSTRPSNLPWRITPRDLLLSRMISYVGAQ